MPCLGPVHQACLVSVAGHHSCMKPGSFPGFHLQLPASSINKVPTNVCL